MVPSSWTLSTLQSLTGAQDLSIRKRGQTREDLMERRKGNALYCLLLCCLLRCHCLLWCCCLLLCWRCCSQNMFYVVHTIWLTAHNEVGAWFFFQVGEWKLSFLACVPGPVHAAYNKVNSAIIIKGDNNIKGDNGNEVDNGIKGDSCKSKQHNTLPFWRSIGADPVRVITSTSLPHPSS